MTTSYVGYPDAEWHAWRARHIGGSDIAVVAGLNPWASRWALWQRKRGLLPYEAEPADADREQRFRLAHDHEATVAREFALLSGLHIVGEQTWCEHPTHKHHGCTVDGFVTESPTSSIDDALGVAEVKTTAAPGWPTLPDWVLAQAQWQMHVTGLGHAWVPVMFRGQRVQVYEVDRDEADIAALVAVADAFWDDVQAGRPPAPMAADLPALQARYPLAAAGQELALDDKAQLLVRNIAQVRASAKVLRAEEDGLVAQLLERVGAADTLLVNGDVVATWRNATRTRIDTKALARDHPAIASEYERETSYRTLRIKEDADG